MISKVCYFKNVNGLSLWMFGEIELGENDIKIMSSRGLCPYQPSKLFGSSIAYVENFEMSRDELHYLMSQILPNNLKVKEMIVEYYGSSIDANRLTENDAVHLILTDKKDSDKRLNHEEIIYATGLNKPAHTVEYVSEYGYRVMCCKNPVMKIVSSNNSKKQLRVIWDNQNELMLIVPEISGDLSITDYFSGSVYFKPEDSFSINVEPVFDIIGKIDLRGYVQPEKVTNVWINEICKKLNIQDYSASAGVLREKSINKIYETLNEIAENNEAYRNIHCPYFLLDQQYVNETGIAVDFVENVPISDAIALMSRRNGLIILGGNPMFTEKTLKGGAVWYLARMKKKKDK